MKVVTQIKEKIKKVFAPKQVTKPEKIKPLPIVIENDSGPGFVWVKLSPDHPHTGISLISEDIEPHFKPAIKVTGISLKAAKLELCGKLFDWSLLPIISTGDYLSVEIQIFRRWLK